MREIGIWNEAWEGFVWFGGVKELQSSEVIVIYAYANAMPTKAFQFRRKERPHGRSQSAVTGCQFSFVKYKLEWKVNVKMHMTLHAASAYVYHLYLYSYSTAKLLLLLPRSLLLQTQDKLFSSYYCLSHDAFPSPLPIILIIIHFRFVLTFV
ncbi:hypothetical protein VNO78_20807 [Psophocarpus tetragonolobus]|uniref:Uncharacterized protein n=1 Tax=Psophocarpus tetragonolobus TaxID=3891 RepID=A0AAN9SB26_PSOTE